MFVFIVVILIVFVLVVAGISKTVTRRRNKVVIVSAELIVSVGLPILLFNLYEKWFPDYYSHGFLAGMGALVAATVMLIANLVLLCPILNVLSEKYADDFGKITIFQIAPIIMLSAFGQFCIMFLLD
ncbi:hypothetical protein [Paenibacillus planticolens]|uniref:Uncharacterized protein n=1 Tax=Paenibacillus planticolens TaxID=2654976 RepID=A0ABX1ZTS7_9BACL|nr:hypothetical protein [Paenibacillus planticolens]NOV03221.1 hypothetical protein [Paenibacillus planticolens]